MFSVAFCQPRPTTAYDLEVLELLSQTDNVLLVSESHGGSDHFTALNRWLLIGEVYILNPPDIVGTYTQFVLGNDLRFMHWFVTGRLT